MGENCWVTRHKCFFCVVGQDSVAYPPPFCQYADPTRRVLPNMHNIYIFIYTHGQHHKYIFCFDCDQQQMYYVIKYLKKTLRTETVTYLYT